MDIGVRRLIKNNIKTKRIYRVLSIRSMQKGGATYRQIGTTLERRAQRIFENSMVKL